MKKKLFNFNSVMDLNRLENMSELNLFPVKSVVYAIRHSESIQICILVYYFNQFVTYIILALILYESIISLAFTYLTEPS